MTDIQALIAKWRKKVHGPCSTYHESVVLDVNLYEALLGVAEAAACNAELWDVCRSRLPENFQLSPLDPAYRPTDSLSVKEALARLAEVGKP